MSFTEWLKGWLDQSEERQQARHDRTMKRLERKTAEMKLRADLAEEQSRKAQNTPQNSPLFNNEPLFRRDWTLGTEEEKCQRK